MLFPDDDDSETFFLRNVRRVATRYVRATNSTPDALLGCFLTDLTFWEPCQTNQEPDIEAIRQSASGTSQSLSYADYSYSSSSRSSGRSMGDWSGHGPPSLWREAVDPYSGRKYYYDEISRRSQWEKPPEIRAKEKRQRVERRRQMLLFFRQMEENVMASLERGELIPGIPLNETKDEGPPLEPIINRAPEAGPRVRTISGMDHRLLEELRAEEPMLKPLPRAQKRTSSAPSSLAKNRPPLPTSAPREGRPSPPRSESTPRSKDVQNVRMGEDLELAGEKLLDAPLMEGDCDMAGLEQVATTSGHQRRNTGGTLYVQNTMMNPDITATIKCVCGVYRAHILHGAENRAKRSPDAVGGCAQEADVFRDDFQVSRRDRSKAKVPSVADIHSFYEAFYRRSQMEHDTIIVSLIYVEKLLKLTNGQVAPQPENWRSILFSCMVLASKVWDDLSMWNIDFSNVSAHITGLSTFTLPRINQLELCLLTCLNFDVRVPASEYAKYYFLIRSMLLRSGLIASEDKPLGKRIVFEDLEQKTKDYQKSKVDFSTRRSRSMDENCWKKLDRTTTE